MVARIVNPSLEVVSSTMSVYRPAWIDVTAFGPLVKVIAPCAPIVP